MPRKRTGYDAACYYDGKLLGRCTKADSDAYYKECKGRKKQCRKKFRALIVEPRPSGHRGPKS